MHSRFGRDPAAVGNPPANAANRASTETALSSRFTTLVRRLPISGFSFRRFSLSAFPIWLRAYFRSGWAFLIPYLAAYLLYYLLKWPVNPAAGVNGASSLALGTWHLVPSLLSVFWAMHAINVVLAAIALIGLTQRREDAKDQTSRISQKETKTEATPLSPLPPVKWFGLRFLRFLDFTISRFSARFPAFPLSRFAASLLPSPFSLLLQRLAPWFLLALVFYIPGVYLEFPADPWQHYARINEWAWLNTVGEHSAWAKSSYFLAYSFLGQISPPTRQLFWLDFYYTGCCLLLCWQYYRLARALGLGERASMLFVILQTVLFGNNIFGFYRYYGISSSIFAQIGAVALVRVAIEYASQKFQVPRLKFQGTGASPSVASLNTEDAESTESAAIGSASSATSVLKSGSFGSHRTDTPAVHGAAAAGQAPPVSRIPAFPHLRFSSALPSPFSLLQAGASVLALLLLTAFNHVQGLGIAGLGLLAVAIWRLIEWRRSMVWWLAGGALVLSVVAILWFPRDPALAGYVRDGWLTPWYGFNLFAFQLPVGDRTLWILGLFGLVNLAAGLLLLRRNHLVGWLTIIPLIALSLPFVAIPLVELISRHSPDEGVITFARFLFAIPSGLALVALGKRVWQGAGSKEQGTGTAEISLPPSGSLQKEAKEIGPRVLSGLGFQLKASSSTQPNTTTAHGSFLPAPSSLLPAGTSVPRFPPSAFRLSLALLLAPFSLLLVVLTALLLLPANGPTYNRFWQALMIPPDDLAMRQIIKTTDTMAGAGTQDASKFGEKVPVTTPGIGYVLQSAGNAFLPGATRLIRTAPASVTDAVIEQLRFFNPSVTRNQPFLAMDVLYSPYSQGGLLSTHWLPCDVALELSTQEELFRLPLRSAAELRPPRLWLQWSFSREETSQYAIGAGAPLRGLSEDRGSMNSVKGFATPVAGDKLILTPFLETLDSNGWRGSIKITGPDSFHRSSFVTLQPNHWIYSKFNVAFPKPGKYAIELVGDVVWPVKHYTVRYTLIVADGKSENSQNAKRDLQ